MRYILYICRVLVGSLFIVSGLIKANDTLGFSYKLAEYFEPDVLNWVFLEPHALALAMLICIGEVVIGFAVLLGGRMKLTSWFLLGMILFFTWLTFYSAYFEKVTDCGCFGDAIKLTPWESFSKDVILFVLIMPIFFMRSRIAFNTHRQDVEYMVASLVLIGLFSFGMFEWGFPFWFTLIVFILTIALKTKFKGARGEYAVAGMVALASILFVWRTFDYLPDRDFRPYAVGKSIPDQMVVPDGEQPDKYETLLTYKNTATSEVKEFSAANYPWDDEAWVWVSTENRLVKKGYTPPIHDFMLTDNDGVDVTDGILEEPGEVFLLIAYDISASKAKCQPAINALAQEVQNAGGYFYGITSSGYEQTEAFRHEHQNPFDYLRADGIMLKTIVRSNPGLIMIKGGVVMGKWPCTDIPSLEEARERMSETTNDMASTR